jgi:hypothetical protein
MKSLASLLRALANFLDPKEASIELWNVNEPLPHQFNIGISGQPVYYWKTGVNSFSLWPVPNRELKLCYKAG